jgi:glutaredoxin
LKDNIVLYVKSEKAFVPGYSESPITHTGWWIDGHGALPTAAQVIRSYRSEDQEAIDLLKRAGIAHKLVDLSNCSFSARLKSKMMGVNETPTLILNDKKIRGFESIKKLLQGIKP